MYKRQIYDKDGREIPNKKILRGDKSLADDEYIKLAIVWIKSNNKYLIQKSSTQKGGDYAVSGGHVPYGVSSREQALVELKEELGISINKDQLEMVGNIFLPHCIFDVYLYEDDSISNSSFVLQESEVEAVYWLSKDEINTLVKQGVFRNSSRLQYEKFFKFKDRTKTSSNL